jgi:hypothetical protein
VFPASVPGHKTDLSGDCNACRAERLEGSAGCDAGFLLACAPLLLIRISKGLLDMTRLES